MEAEEELAVLGFVAWPVPALSFGLYVLCTDRSEHAWGIIFVEFPTEETRCEFYYCFPLVNMESF